MPRSEQLIALSAAMGSVELTVSKIRALEPKHQRTAIAYARDLLDELAAAHQVSEAKAASDAASVPGT
jgi:hypothetical protein